MASSFSLPSPSFPSPFASPFFAAGRTDQLSFCFTSSFFPSPLTR